MATDVSLVTPIAGLITALPVVTMYVLGLSLGRGRLAIAMAIGANLIAIASLVGAPRLSIRLAVADAIGIALSVFVGTATESVPWLHVALLSAWCFGAGMLTVYGQTHAVIGSQAIVAYVVLGRFSGSLSSALHVSAFVLGGALVELIALVVLRLPPSLRFQHNRVANAFDAVAELAVQSPGHTAIQVLAVLDDAQLALSTRSLFGRVDVQELRAVLDQVRRIRLEVTTLSGLRVRLATMNPSTDTSDVERCLHLAAATLHELARALRRSSEQSSWKVRSDEFKASIATLSTREAHDRSDIGVVFEQCLAHLRDIDGQLRSAGTLLTANEGRDGRVAWRPSIPSLRTPADERLSTDLSLIRDNLRYDAPAFRHAIRLAFAVPASAMLGSLLSLPRPYWLPFAVAVILKPDYSTLLKRGLGRVLGTMMGATIAALVVGQFHPDHALTVVLVALSAWIAYSTWAASFPVAIGFVTAMVLILLSTSSSDTIGTALDRFVDVALGAMIAIISYLVWPTSPRAGVSDAQAKLFGAMANYLAPVLALVESKGTDSTLISQRSRVMRLAWANAESAVGRSVEEPAATRIDPSEGRSLMAAALRILRATHALRIEGERGATVAPYEELEALGEGLLANLRNLERHFSYEASGPDADLRSLFARTEPVLNSYGAPATIAAHLEELVNAINTAAQVSRHDLSDTE